MGQNMFPNNTELGANMSLTDLSEELMMKSSSYKEGIDAYWESIMYEQNPYRSNSIDHQQWADGWMTAEGNDLAYYDY